MPRPAAAARSGLLLFPLLGWGLAQLAQPASAQPLLNALASAAAAASTLRPGAANTCQMEPGAAHAFCGLPLQLANFQGHHACAGDVLVGRPTDLQELARLVQAYSRVKAVGVGHSWWREAFCAGTNASAINVVLTELLHHTQDIRVDEARMTVTAPAGLTQRGLLNFLGAHKTAAAPAGYTLPAASWFIDQTLGGAVATATHGSSLVFGSLSSQLRSMKLLLANGTTLQLSLAASPPHLWNAATVSVGRLGIITEVELMLVKNAPVRRRKTDLSVEAFVTSMRQVAQRYAAAANGNHSSLSQAVWDAIRPWDELQYFWFIPSRSVWEVSFSRLGGPDATAQAALAQVLAEDGPDAGRLLPGAYHQQTVQSVGTGAGIERGATYWSTLYKTFLSQNVQDGVLPARDAYLSVTELESKMGAAFNAYDQYEVAIPLAKAGECFAALASELYGPSARFNGFRTPALVRLIRAEAGFLSPAAGQPTVYINIEDHVSHATGRTNEDFQAIIRLLRSPMCGPGRLHWGKAGHAACFDGGLEYPATWCSFGCAVAELDPAGKFAGEAGERVWSWSARERASGRRVQAFAQCCGPDGFDRRRCECVPREAGC